MPNRLSLTASHISTILFKFVTSSVLFLMLVPSSWAQVRAQVANFHGGSQDGQFPFGGLVTDGAGSFYGTTFEGGPYSCGVYYPSCGTVYELTRDHNGHWSKTIIYFFAGGVDGFGPSGTLVMDARGNLYGTAGAGGTYGYGTVFELTPNNDGSWTKTTLYSFRKGIDGATPEYGVIFDAAGNLFGTASEGGICDPYCHGIVFELVPNQDGTWREVTLYTFLGGHDGTAMFGLTFDAAGNLYGATQTGGNGPFCGNSDTGCGSVFELVRSPDGSWAKTVLYNFNSGLDGGYPGSGVNFDSVGNLYGETIYGGSLACPGSGCGVIYKLTPQFGGTWKFSVAHTFNGLYGRKGEAPAGGLVFDAAGNLYGTTEGGGSKDCFGAGFACGIVFKLEPATNSFTVIASFDGKHGALPEMGVILDAQGNLYGTTTQGGDVQCSAPYGCGVAFEITP